MERETPPLIESTLRVAGRTLGYEEAGTGDAVVLLHSGGLSRRQWRRLRDELSPRFRVVVPDLLGYGASSPWPDGVPFALAQDVEALLALLDRVGPRVHLVGHSYGGLLGLKLALARPRDVLSLALYEPVAFGLLSREDDPDAWSLLDRVPREYQAAPPDGADEAWLRAFVDWWNGPGAWAALGDEVRSGFRRTGWKVFQEVTSLTGDRTPSAAYHVVDAPALLLAGERSPMPARRVAERLALSLPRATLRVIERAGHMAPISRAADVNAAIAQHLDALAGTTPSMLGARY